MEDGGKANFIIKQEFSPLVMLKKLDDLDLNMDCGLEHLDGFCRFYLTVWKKKKKTYTHARTCLVTCLLMKRSAFKLFFQSVICKRKLLCTAMHNRPFPHCCKQTSSKSRLGWTKYNDLYIFVWNCPFKPRNVRKVYP